MNIVRVEAVVLAQINDRRVLVSVHQSLTKVGCVGLESCKVKIVERFLVPCI